MRRLLIITFALVLQLAFAAPADESPSPAPPPMPAGISADDQRLIAHDLRHLHAAVSSLKPSNPDLFADAELFEKGLTWALRYETTLAANDLALVKKSLARGQQRADALAANQSPWTTKKGKVLRGFVSAVDGSVQPYGVIVPQSYDGRKPMRLDVVLHGSSKPVGLSELRFGARFDEGDEEVKPGPDADYIELHPLGRVENCYRWAGETDVFEAIEAVCRNYHIDRDRIVLRGMSMGASGTWHLGLKYPDRWAAIGPYCGYVDTHHFSETPAEQMRRIGEYAAKGRDNRPPQLRFVTWTLKYHHCHWLELLALGAHYERAEIKASAADDGGIEISELKNITRFAVSRPVNRMRILGRDIVLPSHSVEDTLVFAQSNGAWQCDGPRDRIALTGKRPGLQGPIDDAFTAPFLCVRGTGQPWNTAVGAWADASLRRFRYEWARYMRGDLPVKNDTDVTAEDLRMKNLILFGDPGSNMWIRTALPNLPLIWTRDTVSFGDVHLTANDHAPALICASPLPDAGDHYLVLNSGHTFHEKEFATFNYLLFPRLGDWALLHVLPGAETWQPSTSTFPDEVVHSGFFDEMWRKPIPSIP